MAISQDDLDKIMNTGPTVNMKKVTGNEPPAVREKPITVAMPKKKIELTVAGVTPEDELAYAIKTAPSIKPHKDSLDAAVDDNAEDTALSEMIEPPIANVEGPYMLDIVELIQSLDLSAMLPEDKESIMLYATKYEIEMPDDYEKDSDLALILRRINYSLINNRKILKEIDYLSNKMMTTMGRLRGGRR